MTVMIWIQSGVSLEMTIEKLFIGFWVCHTGEWLFSLWKYEKKVNSFQKLQVSKLEAELEYWREAVKTEQFKFALFKYKNREAIEEAGRERGRNDKSPTT